MLSIVIALIDLVLIVMVFKIFKTITDNQDNIITILHDEVIELNKELQALRDDGK